MLDVVIRSLNDAFGMGVWIIDRDDSNHVVRVLRPVEFKWQEYVQGHLLPEPTIAGRTQEVEMIFEKFIEQVKEAGYGRDKLSVESGELKATKEHLTDMKRLVFDPPPHFAPLVIADGEPGQIYPRRTPFGGWTVAVKANRVRRAAKQCSNARGVLAELFPEVFGPGWEHEAD